LPKAQGDAAKLVDDAKAYADRVVTQAEGDADRFKQVYAQYSKAPAVIRERMYLETMQEIYSKATKVFVGNKAGSSVVYLPLDKLVEQGRQNAANAAGASSAATAAGAAAPDTASAPAAVASGAPASGASAAAAPAAGSDVLRSREAFRSRAREDDLK
jgi:membrane protease subunit HflK